MLGPVLDPSNPFSAALMAGSENYISSPYFPWGNHQQINSKPGQQTQMYSSFDGLSNKSWNNNKPLKH